MIAPTPLLSSEDFEEANIEAFGDVSRTYATGLAIRLTIRDLGSSSLSEELAAALRKLEKHHEETTVILDFSGADLSDEDEGQEVISFAIQRMRDIGRWPNIIVQATSYPEKNPAAENGTVSLVRRDWRIWRRIAEADPELLDILRCGDFGADSAKFQFGGAAIPIPHYRWSSPEHWVTVRGARGVRLAETMKATARRLTETPDYPGRGFSRADDLLWKAAQGLISPGDASMWRALNTAHHITRVVSDLGQYYGYKIAPHVFGEQLVQGRMFP